MHFRRRMYMWLAACLFAALAACNPQAMTALDLQVQRMIDQQQRESLGSRAAGDPNITPVRETDAAITDSTYAKAPATTNPSVDALTARTDPMQGRFADGDIDALQMLMDDTDALHMNLAQVLAYAIAHSPEYRNSKESLYIAALNLLIERHLWGPRFFNDITASFTGTPEAGDHEQAMTVINETRITQRLPHGGEVSVRALVSYVNALRQASASTGPRDTQAADVIVSGDIPLLRGAGLVAQESRIQTERDLIYAVRSFERFRREFLVDIAVGYFTLLAARAQIDNTRFQVGSLERLAARFDALARAGREPSFEAERSQQQVLFGRNDLINRLEGYAAALDAFKIRIGMPVSEPLAIDPFDLDVPSPMLDPRIAIEAGLAQRLDLQISRDLVDDARRGVEIARNDLLPDADIFADLTLSSDTDKDRAGVDLDLGDSSYTAGVFIGLPLDRRIEQLRYRQSLIALERAGRSYRLERDRVVQNIRGAIRQIERARFTLELQRRNVYIAERRKKGVLLRERSLGPRDVIESEQDLLDARNSRDTALRDLRVSILRFLLETGQMRVDGAGQWLAPVNLRSADDADKPEALDAARDEAGDVDE